MLMLVNGSSSPFLQLAVLKWNLTAEIAAGIVATTATNKQHIDDIDFVTMPLISNM
jgi:hypothetical protein